MSRSQPNGSLKQALRVGLIYLVISVLWIYLSDLAVERLFSDPAAIRRAQTLKGWAFVVASAVLITFLVHRELTRVREMGGRFRALVEQSLAGVYLIQDGRFRYVNPTLARIFGYEPAEIMDEMPVEELVAPEDREMVLGNVEARIEDARDERHYRFTGLRKDGETVTVEAHGSRILWEGAPAVLGVLLDVSDRESLERQAREAQKMEALGKLTGQVAHDFNNFLTGIIGPLDICRSILEPGTEASREVEEARETAMRAASLSQKLLAFSRHRVALPRPVEVNTAIRGVEPLLGRLVLPPVQLRLDLDPEAGVVFIDPSALEQVLVNLVMNAAEAVDESGTVVVRTRSAEGDLVRLEVQDDGRGIDQDDQEQIFQPFFTTKEEGTGLGLSTVYGIVSQAEGRVEVDSDPGEGTRMTVVLPRSEEAAEASPVAAEEPKAPRSLKGSEVILLVEDEASVRRTVRRALERAGYAVLDSGTGEAALETARGSAVDLLLTDVQLPDLQGPELADRLKAISPDLPVLYMSGYSEVEVTESLAGDPSTRLLEKPFTMEELLQAVRGALDAGSGAAAGEAV